MADVTVQTHVDTFMRSATASAARDALGIQSGATYSTVAEMVAADVTNIASGQTVTLTGYYAAGDFGEPLQLVVEASTGGVKSHTLADARYANLYAGEALKPSWFGAKADDASGAVATANTTAINECFTAAGSHWSRTVHIDGRYYVDGAISCPASVHSITGITPRRSCIFQNTASTTTLQIAGGSGNEPRLENFGIVDTNFVLGTTVFTDMTHIGLEINNGGINPMSAGSIFNLYIEGFGVGIKNPDSFVMTYRNCRVKNCRLGYILGDLGGGSTTQLAIQCWADTCLSWGQTKSVDTTLIQCAWDLAPECMKDCEYETEGLNGWSDLTGVYAQGNCSVFDFAYESYGLTTFELDVATLYPTNTASWAVGATANQFNLFMVSGSGHSRFTADGVKFVGVENTDSADTINILKAKNTPDKARYRLSGVRFDYVDGNNGGEAAVNLLNADSGGSFTPVEALCLIEHTSFGTNGTLTTAGETGTSIAGIVVQKPFWGIRSQTAGSRNLELNIQNALFNTASGSVTLTLPLAVDTVAYQKYDISQYTGANGKQVTMVLSGSDTWDDAALTTIQGSGANIKVYSDGVSKWYTESVANTESQDVTTNPANTHTGTAASGTSNTITLDGGASAVDDFYNSYVIEITGGTGSGQYNQIVDYFGSTKLCTVLNNWSVTPDATSTFRIHPANTIHNATGLVTVDPTTEAIHLILPDSGDVRGCHAVKVLKISGAANDIFVWPQVGDTEDTSIASADAVQTMLTLISNTTKWHWNKS